MWGFIVKTYGRHFGFGRRFKVSVANSELMQVFCMCNVVVHPVADFRFAIMMKTHPYFEAPESLGLLKSVDIKLVSFIFLLRLIGKIGWLQTKGNAQTLMILYQYGT